MSERYQNMSYLVLNNFNRKSWLRTGKFSSCSNVKIFGWPKRMAKWCHILFGNNAKVYFKSRLSFGTNFEFNSYKTLKNKWTLQYLIYYYDNHASRLRISNFKIILETRGQSWKRGLTKGTNPEKGRFSKFNLKEFVETLLASSRDDVT